MTRKLTKMAKHASACLLGLAGAFAMVPAAQAQVAPAVELCVAIDWSYSINDANWALQVEAYRKALVDPTIVPQDGSVAVSIVGFSTTAETRLGMTTVTPASVAAGGAISNALDALLSRPEADNTAIGDGIQKCAATFTASTTVRKVIDVSTDGQNNQFPDPEEAADAAVAAGVNAINLIGVGEYISAPDLRTYARPQPAKTIGEGDGFVMIADIWEDFEASLHQKLAVEIKPTPLLSVTKDNGVDSVTQGATTTYTVTIENTGTVAATDVSWADTSTGLNVTAIGPGTASTGSVAGPCTASGCSGITVAAGGNVSYPVEATVTGAVGSNAVNTATVTGANCPNAASCVATDEDPIAAAPLAALSVTKSNGVDSVTAGATTTYTVTIQNTSEVEATGVSWADTFTGLNVTAITAGAASTGSVAGNCTTSGCTGITVAAGGSVSYAVQARVTGAAGTNAVNTATVTGGTCPGSDACAATDEDPIEPAPIVPVPKEVTPVPTMSEWGLILLTALLAGMAWVGRRRNLI